MITEYLRQEEEGRGVRVIPWTDPRDGRHWTVWLVLGKKPVLAFASEGDTYTVDVDFSEGLGDRSDEVLQRLLDEGRG